MKTVSLFLATAFAAVALPAPSASAGLMFQVTDLGNLGGSPTIGRGINSSGQVTGDGWTSNSGGADHAFIYSGGVIRDIGGVAGFGINSSGQVAGLAAQHAFLYTNGIRKDLGTLGGSTSSGRAVNDAGQVVGEADLSNNSQHAFLYSGGSMHDLGTLGGTDSVAFGINASGQVTGRAITTGNTANHAFLYSASTMTDLDGMAGSFSVGFALNSSAQVTGSMTRNGIQHAFLYSSGVMKDLGTLGGSTSEAIGINDSGQVVGDAYVPGDPNSHAFLYGGGVMTDLNSLITPGTGWFLEQATAINNKGQITGYGHINGQGGGTRAFLLTPVPEPSGIVLVAMVGLALTICLVTRGLLAKKPQMRFGDLIDLASSSRPYRPFADGGSSP